MKRLLLFGIVLVHLQGFTQDTEKPITFHTNVGIDIGRYRFKTIIEGENDNGTFPYDYDSFYRRLSGGVGLTFKKIVRLDIGTSVSGISSTLPTRFFGYSRLSAVKNVTDEVTLHFGISHELFYGFDNLPPQNIEYIYQNGIGLNAGISYKNARITLEYVKYPHKGVEPDGMYDFAVDKLGVRLSYDILNFPRTRKK